MPRKSTKVPRPSFPRRGAGSGNETKWEPGTSWHVSNVLGVDTDRTTQGRHRTTQCYRKQNGVGGATECLRGRETASKDRGRRLTAPTRPCPAAPRPSRCSPRSPQHNTLALSFVCCCQVYKELPDVLSCGEQRDGRGAAGHGLVGAVFLLPRSLLAVSLPRKHSVAPPTPRFAYDNIAPFGVYPDPHVTSSPVSNVRFPGCAESACERELCNST